MIWLLIGYIWLYVYRPFEIWPVLGTFQIERVYMCLTIAVWCLSEKTWTSNRLNPLFLFMLAALVFSWLFSPYPTEGWRIVEGQLKIAVFYLLIVSTVHDSNRLKLIITGLVGSTALYMLHSLIEFQNGKHVYRMGIARMIGVDSTFNDPNSFAAVILYSLPFLVPFGAFHKNFKGKMAVAIYFLLAVSCVLLTGSRTGLIGLFGYLGMMAWLSKHRMRFIILGCLASPFAWYALPTELQIRFFSLIDPSVGQVGAKDSADSRWMFFEQSYQLFADRPLFGYGPGSFPLASGTGAEVHSLYGQLLGEFGTIGIICFLLIISAFILNQREVIRLRPIQTESENTILLLISNAICVSVALHLVLGFGGHNLYRHTWVWFGSFQVVLLGILRSANCRDTNHRLPALNGEIKHGDSKS